MARTRIGAWAVATAFYLYNGFVTRVPSYFLRHLYLRKVLGISLGRGCAVHMGCFVTGRAISIGEGSVVNRRCYLDGRGGLSIGAHVSVSPECYLVTLGHDPDHPDFPAVAKPVRIGDRAWIGARAMVLPGADVAEGTVVGAGSVVTRPTEAYTKVAGIPARKIGERSRDLRYRPGYFPWYDTDVQ